MVCTLNLEKWFYYLINRSFFSTSAADQTSTMQDQMSGAAGAMPQDPKAAFKAEWEALEITEYTNALQNVEAELLTAMSASSPVSYGNAVSQ